MTRDMKMTMTKDSYLRLWGLSASIQFLPLSPPLTQLKQGNKMPYLPLHAHMTKKLAILWRGLPAPNIWQDTPTNARGRFWWLWVTPKLWTYMTWCGLRSLYWIAGCTYVFLRHPGQQSHSAAQSRSASNPTTTAQSRRASNPTLQPDQIDMPPDHELMEPDIPDFIDVPEEVISDFDALAQSVLDYPWKHDNISIFWTLINNVYRDIYFYSLL